MVKDKNSGGPELPQSVKLSNGSCSAEAGQVKELSCNAPKVSAVNGNSADKPPVKEVAWGSMNGKCSNTLPVNGMPTGIGNCNNQPIKETPTVNGYCNTVLVTDILAIRNSVKVSVNDIPTVNGNSETVSVNDVPTLNGDSAKLSVNDVPTVNGDDEKKIVINDVPTVNGNYDDSSPVGVAVLNENFSNGSNTPLESGSCSNIHVSDSLCEEVNPDKNELKFTEVKKKKKRNKNKQKNDCKKDSSNLPPGMNAESSRCDKRIDKKLDEKTSPTHLSHKPPMRNTSAIRCSEKSYSSALVNGHNGNSQVKNVPKVYSDTQNVMNAKSNKSNNCDSPGNRTSVGRLPTDTAKSVDTTDILAVKCKQSNSSTKVAMTDVSAQTDVCFQNEMSPSQKECLPSCEEVIHESEKSDSLIDSVEDTDFVGETTDESSNAAYCESVVSNDSGRGDDEIIYDSQMPYCCEFPKEKVKILIGKGGRNRYDIMNESGATFWVPKNVLIDKDTTIIAFQGTGAQIKKAKELIKSQFSNASLRQWLGPQSEQLNGGLPLSDSFSATLPVGTDFMGVVSCIFNPQYFWLQQYAHPEYHLLEDLERRMSDHFNTVLDAPGVVNPMIGNVVAVPVFFGENENMKWVRGEVIHIIPENGNIIARYLDHGGEVEIPASEIRPMRHEFLSIPFFAAKCCLFSVIPLGGVWLEEACAEFKRLCSSIHHPPIVKVITEVPDYYFVSIAGYDDETNLRVDVATTLIQKGLAQLDYTLYQHPEPTNALVQ